MLDIRATAYASPLSEVDFASVPLTVRLSNVADETGHITGLFRVYNDSTGLLIFSSALLPFSLAAGATADVSALTDFDPPAPADSTYFVTFDGHASNALVPHGIDFALGAFYFDVKPVGMGPAPAAHGGTHENGGSDELDVTDLGGVLADPQTPAAHAAAHATGGADELSHGDLEGLTDDDHPQYLTRTDAELFDRDQDFLASAATGTVLAPWIETVITSGTLTSVAGNADHPGVHRIASGAAAGSGAYVLTRSISMLLAGLESFDAWVNLPTVAAVLVRLGFLDTATAADATDGVYLEIAQVGGVNGTTVGKTAAAGVRSTSATSYVLSAGTWYRLTCELDATAALATFTIRDAAGATLWTDTLAANIPTVAGQECGCGIVATTTGGAAISLADVDRIRLQIRRTLVR